MLDPATSGPTVAYKYATDPSLGFDASGNFYMLVAYSNGPDFSSSSSGALVLQKYNFGGNAADQGRIHERSDGADLQLWGIGHQHPLRVVEFRCR